MRLRERNKQRFFYATRSTSSTQTDSMGNPLVIYSEPIEFRANIRQPSGTTIDDYFGGLLEYDRVITTDLSCPIDENCVLWIDNNGVGSFDYIVARIADSINYKVIAVKKVLVS